MRTADMVKSKFWRARDVEGQPPKVLTIADVTEELLSRGARQDVKCFLWFSESPKGLQLNKTRVNLLEAAYGPDSEAWIGQRVRLSFDPTVEFGGRAVGGVRLQTPPGVVWQGLAPGSWGAPAAAPGRPPAPVWDEKRQMWITPQPPPASAAPAPSPAVPRRPPPPVWNEAAQRWDIVDASTGEIAAPKPAPGHEPIPAGRGLSALAGRTGDDPGWSDTDAPQNPHQRPATADGEFDDDIPF